MSRKQPPPTSVSTPFKRHLSHFDRDNDGFITPYECLQSSLSVGVNFPLACVTTFGLRILYGSYNPFNNAIDIAAVPIERTMMQEYKLSVEQRAMANHRSITRSDMMGAVRHRSYFDQLHVLGLWTLAADREGNVSPNEVLEMQKGTLLDEVEKRRRYRKPDDSNVLSFVRGGPISVAGHAYFVKRLFHIDVYQEDTNKND